MAQHRPTGGGWQNRMVQGARVVNQERIAVPSEDSIIENDANILEKPIASVTEHVVPSTSDPARATPVVKETPVAVESTTGSTNGAETSVVAEKPVIQTGPKVIKLQDKSTLIEIPGEQAKSAEQIAFELRKSRDLTRTEANLQFREKQLREREAEYDRKALIKPEPKPEPVVIKRERPAPPKDVVPGEPEWDQYLISLGAFEGAQATEDRLKPQLDRIAADIETRTQRELESAQQKQAFDANLSHNRGLYVESLSVLPFDFESLDETTQNAVAQKIDEKATELGLDLKQGGHLRQFLPTELRGIMQAAFPNGSLPPGYRAHAEEIISPEIEALKELEDKPLVPKDKPQPLHQVGVPGISARKERPVVRSSSWQSRMDAKVKELQQ